MNQRHPKLRHSSVSQVDIRTRPRDWMSAARASELAGVLAGAAAHDGDVQVGDESKIVLAADAALARLTAPKRQPCMTRIVELLATAIHAGGMKAAVATLMLILPALYQALGGLAGAPSSRPLNSTYDLVELAQAGHKTPDECAQRMQALDGEHTLDSEGLDIAFTLDCLARRYAREGSYVQAEELCRRALIIKQKHLGRRDPAVLESAANLAVLTLLVTHA
jgi:hypothetical protein